MTQETGMNEGTDGTSIVGTNTLSFICWLTFAQKPVSSLRSHFEALKPVARTPDAPSGQRETSAELVHPQAKRSAATATVLLECSSAFASSGSLDANKEEKPVKPKAASIRSRPLSSASGRKRPTSIDLPATSLPPPLVTINSPRSPPKLTHGSRRGSDSPDRSLSPIVSGRVSKYDTEAAIQASPLAKQQSLQDTDLGIPGLPERSGSTTPSKFPPRTSSIAPVVNRTEKPNIPPKPKLYEHGRTRLTPEPTEIPERGISPFSTPPSSEGSPSPERQVFRKQHTSPESMASKSHIQKKDDRYNSPAESIGQKLREPQLVGFQGPTGNVGPQNPRSMGSSARPVIHGRSESRSVRASTVSEHPSRSSTPGLNAQDPPTLTPAVKPRHVSEQTRTAVPNIPSLPLSGFRSEQGDSRQLTSSKASAVGPKVEGRRAPPPPPPIEERKTHQISRSTAPLLPPTKTPTRSVATVTNPSSQNATISPDFPRPPRRHTFEESGSPTSETPTTKFASTNAIKNTTHLRSENPGEEEQLEAELQSARSEYPDSSHTNRRPPHFHQGTQEIPIKFDSRVFDICGRYASTTGYVTRAWDLFSGEQVMNLSHGETVKMLSVAFKPGRTFEEEGTRIWIGSNIGELHEIDVKTQAIVATSMVHNRREVIRILRRKKDLLTLDDEGKLFVWLGDKSGAPSLKTMHQTHRVPRGHTFSMVVRDELWYAAGRELSIFRPGQGSAFSVLQGPSSQSGTGDITSGAFKGYRSGTVYLGHADGKVSMYSAKNYTCTGIMKVSDYKINAMSTVGEHLWIAYKTGKIYVYEATSKPWKVKKDWRAHDGPVASMLVDLNSVFGLDRLPVASLGHDNCIRFWDGMLEEDWQEAAMQEKDVKYCSFREIRAAVMTWNVGACNPSDIRDDIISDAIHVEDPPEILVFGFQEIVDLEDRAVTAKSILGFGKKKDRENARSEQHVSRVYRQWRDYLGKCIHRYVGARHAYTEVHTSCLIGLFQCIFVRQNERGNVANMSSTEVKCGMKGHYGNKGALVTRFMLDDSSLCFVNCHLAAGQTQTSHRNNDIASILEADSLPAERNAHLRTSFYVGGGDGTQVLDHEICILNGDLNYRIDAIPRNNVVKMIEKGELDQLLERDQINVCRRRVSGFRLGVFNEAPITFAPTYKYDVGTDRYDSSEKKRSPAWCDRLLYRGVGRIKQVEYRRHEIRVSDHRPVSGLFRVQIKTIDPDDQKWVRSECQREFGEMRRRVAAEAGMEYLITNMGYTEKDARTAMIEDG